MNYWTLGKDNIWVAAHRGWRTKYPENTMEAFKAAMSLGVDQLETDIRVTKDGELDFGKVYLVEQYQQMQRIRHRRCEKRLIIADSIPIPSL